MSSIVADELAKIKSFETDTEKRRSELTLNELNYISDKQLHKKDSGGGGGGDSTFDVLFEIDPETPSARLVKGHYSDLDLTTPNAKVGAYYKPYGSQMPNIVFSVSAMIGAVPEDAVAFRISAILQQGEKFYNLLFGSDDTVEIEEISNPFPPSIEQITLRRGNGSPNIRIDVCQNHNSAFVCARSNLASDNFVETIAPISTYIYDASDEILTSGITFDPADAGSYDGGRWVITKNCTITYTPSNDPPSPEQPPK